jgi:hypothetical protein
MSNEEQLIIKQKYYTEAIRYMNNAKETLQKAGKEDKFYNDEKYVKTACGIAYNGVLKAVDGYFYTHGVEKAKGRKSVEYYKGNMAKLDKKLLTYFNNAYELLHLWGYYDGTRNVAVVKEGFDLAYEIIDKIKPTESYNVSA